MNTSVCVDPSNEDGFGELLCTNTLLRTGSESLSVSTLAALTAFEKNSLLSPTGGPRPNVQCQNQLHIWAESDSATMTCTIEVSG